jgi:hypothetical protein
MRIIDDTLKRDGAWSKQSLTMFISFIITIILGGVNTFMSYYTHTYNNQIAEGVFDTFAILTGSLSGINVGDKLVNMKKAKQAQQEGYTGDTGTIDTMNKL